MILFQLKCTSDHRFEAWFRDGATYEAQAADGAIACPVCGDAAIAKAPMAPRIAKGAARGEAALARERAEIAHHVEALKKTVEENCDYVGDRFAEEARRIHYGETEARGIYGEATASEAESLKEEGVTFQRIPWPARTDS